MTYYIAQPQENFIMMGSSVELDESCWYLVLHATNQPDNERKYFVVFVGDGYWGVEDHDDIDNCIGFLLDVDELIFHDETYEDLDDALEDLNQLNTME